MRRLMAAVLVLATSGCSFAKMETVHQPYSPVAEPNCDRTSNYPGIDAATGSIVLGLAAAGAAGALGVFGNVATPSDPTQTESQARANLGEGAAVIGAAGIAFIGSAIYGYHKRGQCREAWLAWEPVRQEQARQASTRLERQQATAPRPPPSETPHCPVPEFRLREGASIDEINRAEAAWNAQEQQCRQEELAKAERDYAAQRAQADKERAEEAAREKALKDEQERQREEQEKREAPLRAELNALDGFQTARWGMSPQKVRALFPSAARSGNRMQARAQIVGFPATITFFFAQQKLKTVLVAFPRSNKVASEDSLMTAVGNALISKYGTPEKLEVSLGYGLEWEGEKTVIDLRSSVASANLMSAAEIQYNSVVLESLEEDVTDKAKKDL